MGRCGSHRAGPEVTSGPGLQLSHPGEAGWALGLWGVKGTCLKAQAQAREMLAEVWLQREVDFLQLLRATG